MKAKAQPSLNLSEALRRLGLPPSDRLTYQVAQLAAPLLGIEQPKAVSLIDQSRRRAELTRAVLAALAERFPDLVVNPGRVQGRALSPLVVRLERLLAAIPEETQKAGLALLDVRQRLHGKYGRTARADAMGNAFRSLGWVRVRGWSDAEGGFRAYWFPPGTAEAVEALQASRSKRAPRASASRSGSSVRMPDGACPHCGASLAW